MEHFSTTLPTYAIFFRRRHQPRRPPLPKLGRAGQHRRLGRERGQHVHTGDDWAQLCFLFILAGLIVYGSGAHF
jgi:hypothetical protein